MEIDLIYLTQPSLIQIIGFVSLFIYGVYLSNFFISQITSNLYLLQKRKDKDTSFNWEYSRKQSEILGIVERSLYITSFLINAPEFIAIWFTIKMAINWKRWSDAEGRLLFNIFLIGNGLSIIFSISAFLSYKASLIENQNIALQNMAISLVLPLLLYLLVNSIIKSIKN